MFTKKSWKTRLGVIAATTATTGALVLGGGAAANAINRVPCNSYDYTWVYSNQTTCWANAGGRYVFLYSVGGVSGGNNQGWLRADNFDMHYFRKWQQKYWSPQTITYINIDAL